MQKKLIIGLALLVGIGIALFAYTAINKQVEVATQTVEIVVLKSDVDALSVISSKNITTKSVPPNIVDEFTATKVSQVENMFVATPQYAGKAIDLRNVIDPKEDIQDKQVVGIYTDAARYAGVTEGDIVDIYRLDPVAGNASPCIAYDSRILKIIDNRGITVQKLSSSVVTETGALSEPHIAYVLVNPGEVSLVIQGSSDQNQSHLAFAKKSKESMPDAIEEVVEEEDV